MYSLFGMLDFLEKKRKKKKSKKIYFNLKWKNSRKWGKVGVIYYR